MEASELRTNDKEEAVRLVGVLHVWKEGWVEPEGERDLCRLVEVGLQDGFIEDEEALEDLMVVRIGSRPLDPVLQLLLAENLLRVQSLIR